MQNTFKIMNTTIQEESHEMKVYFQRKSRVHQFEVMLGTL